jgi:hypothetical protein
MTHSHNISPGEGFLKSKNRFKNYLEETCVKNRV